MQRFLKKSCFYSQKWYDARGMNQQTQVAERVAARRERLARELKMSERVATAKVARGNVYLLMGKYATEEDLQQRLMRLSKSMKTFA